MKTTHIPRYEIRQAVPTDIGELIRMQAALQDSMDTVRQNLLRPARANTAKLYEYYRARMQDEQTRLVIAEAGDPAKAVGMGTGKIWVHADYLPARSGELIDLWIDPPHRDNKLARRIIGRLLQFFKANGVGFLVVNYVNGNAVGEHLWRRLGFEPVLITAVADRVETERALGISARPAVPLLYRSVPAGRASTPVASAARA